MEEGLVQFWVSPLLGMVGARPWVEVPDRSDMREERLIWPHWLTAHSNLVGKTRRQRREAMLTCCPQPGS